MRQNLMVRVRKKKMMMRRLRGWGHSLHWLMVLESVGGALGDLLSSQKTWVQESPALRWWSCTSHLKTYKLWGLLGKKWPILYNPLILFLGIVYSHTKSQWKHCASMPTLYGSFLIPYLVGATHLLWSMVTLLSNYLTLHQLRNPGYRMGKYDFLQFSKEDEVPLQGVSIDLH